MIGDPPHKPDSAVGLVNRFLSAKSQLLESGELSPRTFTDYRRTCQRLVNVFGWARRVDDLLAEDFERLRAEISKTCGPVAVAAEIGRVRVVFRYATDNSLVKSVIQYGQAFRKPSRKTMRISRAERGRRTFDAAEIEKMLRKATPVLKAMILLGINCGLGQSDLAQLPVSAIDLKGGWLNYPRPKTGIDRRCKLWPETIKAIREALPLRGAPRNLADSGLAFIRANGMRWSQCTAGRNANCAITLRFRELMDSLGINGHRGFYGLRRGFETVAGGSRDQVAVDQIMGHAPASNDMAAVYRDGIEDDRLVAVAEHVRRWLFQKSKSKK